MLGSFFKFVVIGIAVIIGLKVVLAAVGLAIGLITMAIPLAILGGLGYGAYKLWGPKKSKQISDADRRWLES